MPLPQVSDRIKELPGQVLRAVFAGVGQLLLAADKVRAQLAGPADAPSQPPATPPSPTATASSPAVAPPAASATPPAAAAPPAASRPAATLPRPADRPAADSGDSRWRSLDKTGNVRLLHDGDEDLAKAASAPPAAPAEPVPAEPAAAEPAEVAETAPAAPTDLAEPAPAEVAEPAAAEVAEPAPAEPVVAEPTAAADTAAPEPTAAAKPAAAAKPGAAAEALPVAGYDGLTVASLRARLRVLDVAQVQTLLDYEKAHQSRADVVTMFERRIAKLEQGG